MGNTLSDIEFMVCPEDLKESYVRYRAANNHSLGHREKLWCSDSLMDELLDIYIDNFYTLDDTLLMRCSPQQLRKYFEKIIGDNDGNYYSYNLAFCPIDMKDRVVDFCIERGDDFEYDEFKEFSTAQKLNYIIQNGLNRLEEEFCDWYKSWKTAKSRDYKIDSIFEDL